MYVMSITREGEGRVKVRGEPEQGKGASIPHVSWPARRTLKRRRLTVNFCLQAFLFIKFFKNHPGVE